MLNKESFFGYEHGIYAVDSGYERPLLAAIHLIVENGRVAIVDCGVNASLPRVEAALTHLGLRPQAVDYILLTHVHLDHAGGAGAMMQAFPQARLIVHPRGARHMIDPAKLVAGVSAVYGAEFVARVYGQLQPVAADRIVEAAHEQVIDLAGRKFTCLDTPGHARHHICFHDAGSNSIFSGDMFGISYRDMDVREGERLRQFVFPTTTPVQFEPAEMHASIDLLLARQPRYMYCTHFAQVDDLSTKGKTLHRLVSAHCNIALQHRDAGGERHQRIKAGLGELLQTEAETFGTHLNPADLQQLWAGDIELNAQGLGVWLDSGAVGAG